MVFEWDDEKNRTNKVKHGFDFEAALHIFDDPNAIVFDGQIVAGEQRWLTIGIAGDATVVLAVAHTYSHDNDEEVIRIISARKATPRERRAYAGEDN